MINKTWEMVGYIGVDAGLCWLGDPCYILHRDDLPDSIGKDWDGFCSILSKVEPRPRTWSFDYDMGHEGLGVCVSTGWGDGMYPVEVRKNREGRIAEVRVVFITDEAEDVDEEVCKEVGIE